jgi:phosphate starvation-inducible protein PhoH
MPAGVGGNPLVQLRQTQAVTAHDIYQPEFVKLDDAYMDLATGFTGCGKTWLACALGNHAAGKACPCCTFAHHGCWKK